MEVSPLSTTASPDLRCPRCGHPFDRSDRFCRACGTSLDGRLMRSGAAAVPFAMGCAGTLALLGLPILVLTLRSAFGGEESESEPNEVIDTATVFRWGQPLHARFDEVANGRQRDVFYIPPSPAVGPVAEVSVERSEAAPGVVLEVLDADGRVVDRIESDGEAVLLHPNLRTGTTGAFITIAAQEDGDLRCVMPGRCEYRLVVRPRPAWDAEEAEPNGDLRLAQQLDGALPAVASLGWAGDVDVWRLPALGADERAALRIEGSVGIDPTLELLDGDGAVLRTVNTAGIGADELTRFDHDTFPHDPEFVRVSGVGRPERTYRVELELSPAHASEVPTTATRVRGARARLNREEAEGSQ